MEKTLDKQNLESYNELVPQNLERCVVMNKEKILESARNNKEKGMEFENKIATRSSILGCLVAVIVGIGLFLLEYFIKDSTNVGLIAVGMTALGTQSLYEGIKVKKIYLIIVGAIQLIITLFAILVFIGQVVFQ